MPARQLRRATFTPIHLIRKAKNQLVLGHIPFRLARKRTFLLFEKSRFLLTLDE